MQKTVSLLPTCSKSFQATLKEIKNKKTEKSFNCLLPGIRKYLCESSELKRK